MLQRVLTLLLAALVGLGAWFGLRQVEAEPSFKVDEAEYLTMGLLSVEQWSGARDAGGGMLAVSDPGSWREGIHEVTFGFQSPGLPKLVFGQLARAALGPDNVGRVTPLVFRRFAEQLSDPGMGRAVRLSAREPLLPALEPARGVVAGLAAAIAALLFWCAAMVAQRFHKAPTGGWIAGGAAALLWSTSPAVYEAANYVRPGFFPILFWIVGLAVALALLGVREHLAPEPAAEDSSESLALLSVVTVALGVCLGLAVAGKPGGVVFVLAVPMLLWPFAKRFGLKTLATLCAWALGFAVFVALAPGLWTDTWDGVGQMLGAWRGDFQWQAEQYGGDVEVAASLWDALRISVIAMLRDSGPLGLWLPYVGTLLGLAGLVGCALGATHSRADRLVLGFGVVILAGSALIVPMDRTRYFLPLVLPLALACGLFVERGVVALKGRKAGG